MPSKDSAGSSESPPADKPGLGISPTEGPTLQCRTSAYSIATTSGMSTLASQGRPNGDLAQGSFTLCLKACAQKQPASRARQRPRDQYRPVYASAKPKVGKTLRTDRDDDYDDDDGDDDDYNDNDSDNDHDNDDHGDAEDGDDDDGDDDDDAGDDDDDADDDGREDS